MRHQNSHEAKATEALEKVFLKLNQELGISLKIESRISNHWGYGDFIIELKKDSFSGKFLAEYKPCVDRIVALAEAKCRLSTSNLPGILISSYISPKMADECRKIGLQFIDASGNAYLNIPPIYIFIKGIGKPQNYKSLENFLNPTSLRLLLSFLIDPTIGLRPYRQIAERADISLGAVGTTLQKLKNGGFVKQNNDSYSLLDKQRSFEAWVHSYPSTLRPKLNSKRFSCSSKDWHKDVILQEIRGFWSGEVAVDKLLHNLKPSTQTLYIAADFYEIGIDHLVRKFKLLPNPNGTIEILSGFWPLFLGEIVSDIAPLPVVYADLLCSLDPRNIEAAKELFKEKLGDDFHS